MTEANLAEPILEDAVNSCDIVIVNFNAGQSLKNAVVTALQSPLVARVFVIDNASTDDSINLVSSLVESRVSITCNKTNLGFSAGCNIGIAQCTSEQILLLNPDCSVAPGAIEQLISMLRSGERIGMVGPLLLNPDGSEQAGGRRVIPTPRRVLVRTFGLARLRHRFPRSFQDFLLHQDPLPSRPMEIEAISGACMMVRSVAIKDVGLLDEKYFMHCEDLDWCMRFRVAGWKILFVPTATVIHEKGVCSEQRRYFTEWHKHKGMVRFYRKFLRDRYPSFMLGLVEAGVWLRFAAVVSYLWIFRD